MDNGLDGLDGRKEQSPTIGQARAFGQSKHPIYFVSHCIVLNELVFVVCMRGLMIEIHMTACRFEKESRQRKKEMKGKEHRVIQNDSR